MKKRFIVLLDSTNVEQDKAFLAYVKAQKFGYWHWLSTSWLIADSKGKDTAQKIRDTIKETHPGVHNLIIELNENGDTWSGFGPTSDTRNMFDWIKKNWKKN